MYNGGFFPFFTKTKTFGDTFEVLKKKRKVKKRKTKIAVHRT